jgi:hypothetical protein
MTLSKRCLLLLFAMCVSAVGIAQDSNGCVFTLSEREVSYFLPDQSFEFMAGSNIVFYEGLLGVMSKDDFEEHVRINRDRNLEPYIQVIQLTSGDKKMFAGKLDYVLVLWSKRDVRSAKHRFLKKVRKACFSHLSSSE